ncbi:hypothetical protein Q1J52_21090 [Pseudomonas lijiangensis]|uniref:hypothetical protein n=1 Tax=Pseudomonas lijiangensis TaxID=2995658 RepID=UPI0034D97D2E
MIELLIYPAFLICSLLLYALSLLAKYYFSGKNFSSLKFWLVMAYNIALGNLHFKFVAFSTLPFVGVIDNSILGWLSYLFAIAHAFTLPSPKEKNSNPNIIK